MNKILILSVIMVASAMMTGCSSNSVKTASMNAGCDFVVGAANNKAERDERESRPGNTRSDPQKDIVSGIFSAFIGLFTRPYSGNKDCV
ncbi:hypothetical protein L2735_11060 [Shewanella olleyana]|uniref:hypothetical protein n=1 Tax=Shewanella olleyana TaxID=135626 RepID=UPI00200BB029|nr:hypothetical protein [Shewanella olleyana]MCL1067344.1 hypothetical protein [Shewanella olleyana]